MTDERQIVAEGLSAMAVTFFEMGHTKREVRDFLVAQWQRLGSTDGAFEDALLAMRTMPQPLSESPEEIERARPIREALGVAPADDQLNAALAATELLVELADLSKK